MIKEMATYTDLKLEKTIIFLNGSERGATITQAGFSKFVNPAILYYKENNTVWRNWGLWFALNYSLFKKSFFFQWHLQKNKQS